MKVKNIDRLKSRLEEATTEIRLSDDGESPVTIKYDVWEELFYVSYDSKEILLNVSEAKKLRSVLNGML